MHEFIHHPDGRIVILGNQFSMDFWNIVEPEYILPEGYIGRLFSEGQAHQLIRVGNNSQDQADVNDLEITNYVLRLSEYIEAFEAQQNGSYIYNDDGVIVISGPPLMSIDKEAIADDSIDTVTITCDLDIFEATDIINWYVIAPDGSVTNESENAIDGIDVWELTTSYIGTHQVVAETEYYGTGRITFEGTQDG